MERKSNCTNIITKVGRVSHRITKKLEKSNKINGNSKGSYEKIV